MCRALLAVIALFWASVAEATEVYVCEASFEKEWQGETLTKQYELRIALGERDRALTTIRGDISDFEIINSAVYPLSGSLRVVTSMLRPSPWSNERETQISGFASHREPLVAVVFKGPLEDFPLVVIAYGDQDVFDLGVDPFILFDTFENHNAIGKCQ